MTNVNDLFIIFFALKDSTNWHVDCIFEWRKQKSLSLGLSFGIFFFYILLLLLTDDSTFQIFPNVKIKYMIFFFHFVLLLFFFVFFLLTLREVKKEAMALVYLL